MKKAGKLLSFLLALAMVFSLGITAMAADTYTITIKGDNSTAAHTYEAYQIFAGDLHDPDGNGQGLILSNIVWGTGVNTDAPGFQAAFAGETAAQAASALEISQDAQAFAKKIAPFLSNIHKDSTGSNDSGYTITELPAGYYLVKDQDNSLAGENDFYTAYMMKVVGNVEASPKGAKPTLKKQIQDAIGHEWLDTRAGFQLGDTVNFRTISTVPSSIDRYDSYTYLIEDTMSEGLTSNVNSAADVTIKVSDGETLEQTYYTVTVDADNPNRFTVSIDIKAAIAAGKLNAEQELYVYYSAVLNEKAQVYSPEQNLDAPNANTASLTYSNNPNGSDTGKTPDSTVTVWTFPAIINKVDENGTALTGAKFVVSRSNDLDISGITVTESSELAGENADALKEQLLAFHLNGGVYTLAADSENLTYVVEAGTHVVLNGFGEHTYYLYEIQAPAGFNRLSEPVAFTVSAPKSGALDAGTNPAYITIAADAAEVTNMQITVKNNAGATLPETGGIGTTLFYVIGGLLVVGAGVLLITKKRMGKSDT